MRDIAGNVGDGARIALACIRLFNGAAALFAPRWMIRRLGGEPDSNPVAVHALRMFGIRTVLIGFDLLHPRRAYRERAVRAAVLIHASDTVSALLAGFQRNLSPRASLVGTAISLSNTVLAILAQPRTRSTERSAEAAADMPGG